MAKIPVVKENILQYISTGLTFTSGTGEIVAGGYAKEGNKVTVALRVKKTSGSTLSISGFPPYNNLSAWGCVGVWPYSEEPFDTQHPLTAYLLGSGVLNIYNMPNNTFCIINLSVFTAISANIANIFFRKIGYI